jgi:hypothetical protein
VEAVLRDWTGWPDERYRKTLNAVNILMAGKGLVQYLLMKGILQDVMN